MRNVSLILTILLLSVSLTASQADVINVPGDYPAIQGAIDAAVDGDVVVIAPGTYFECDINFSAKAITVANTTLWENEAPAGKEIYLGGEDDFSILTIAYSDVEGGEASVYVDPGNTLNWRTGMIDADPLFMMYHAFDYLLSPGSPCVDAGALSIEDGISDWHPCCPAGYPNGPRSDMGAYGGPDNGNWISN